MPPIVPLHPERSYHIYNRGNNRENLFVEARNYTYFFDLYLRHIEPVAETFAYCLMKNHFHLLIRVKPYSEAMPEPSRAFSNFFNAYARSFNRAYNRSGALFQRPFRRLEVHDERQFATVVAYIHRNPQKHGFVTDFRDWPYSSYHTLVSTRSTRLKRDVVLAWFGGVDEFTTAHTRDLPPDDIIDDDP